jgi:hypothetical protein
MAHGFLGGRDQVCPWNSGLGRVYCCAEKGDCLGGGSGDSTASKRSFSISVVGFGGQGLSDDGDSGTSEAVEVDPVKDPSEKIDPLSEREEVDEAYESSTGDDRGDWGGVERVGVVVKDGGGQANCRQWRMRSFRSRMEMRSSGLRSKIIPRISFSSSDNGKMVFKKSWFRVKALYVESSVEACFHGLRPQVRLTKITPRDQISLGAQRYEGFRDD